MVQDSLCLYVAPIKGYFVGLSPKFINRLDSIWLMDMFDFLLFPIIARFT